MLHLRLCKALSYSGVVSATKAAPDVMVTDEAVAQAALATGYFRLVEDEALAPSEETPTGTIEKLDVMTVSELKKFAKAKNISLDGAAEKADILARIQAAESGDI